MNVQVSKVSQSKNKSLKTPSVLYLCFATAYKPNIITISEYSGKFMEESPTRPRTNNTKYSQLKKMENNSNGKRASK